MALRRVRTTCSWPDDVGERPRPVAAVQRGSGGHGRSSLARPPGGPALACRPWPTRSWTTSSTGCGSPRSPRARATPRTSTAPPSGRPRRSATPAGRPTSCASTAAPARRRRAAVGPRGRRRRCSSTATTTSRASATAALWSSPPFAPEVRDGRVFARGAADDKGNFWPLLHAACALARAGELPVHVRVARRGRGGGRGRSPRSTGCAPTRAAPTRRSSTTAAWPTRERPAVTTGLRGIVMCDLTLRCGERDLHSGMFGGVALNALHVLHGLLAELLPGPDGRRARGAAGRRRAARRRPSAPRGTGCPPATPRWPRSAPSRSTRAPARSSTSAPGPVRRST